MFVNDLESAKYYDTLPRFSKEVYNYLKELGIYNKIVADVGSGTGRITIDLLNNKNQVYAIDPDCNMRTICQKKCGKYEGFILVDGTDTNMNIPNHSVDYVIVSQSYHRFNPEAFKEECNRVLKNKNNVIIMWYRVDFTNPVYKDMLDSVKKNYLDYHTRYQTDEVTGAKEEEIENNENAAIFFENNSVMHEVISTSLLTKKEFIALGLSLCLFPITHEMNTITNVHASKTFNKKNYVNDLSNIFAKYQINNKITLKFKVQIHSSANIFDK